MCDYDKKSVKYYDKAIRENGFMLEEYICGKWIDVNPIFCKNNSIYRIKRPEENSIVLKNIKYGLSLFTHGVDNNIPYNCCKLSRHPFQRDLEDKEMDEIEKLLNIMKIRYKRVNNGFYIHVVYCKDVGTCNERIVRS